MLVAAVAAAGALAACAGPTGGGAEPTATASSSPTPSPAIEPFTHPWGPTPEEVAAATEEAAAMTPAEVAGQVIVGRLDGTDPAVAADLVTELHLAGVMITGGSVANLEQVLALTNGVQEAVAADGRDWPALLSTDNEGGSVQRLSGDVGPWTTFPAFAVAGRAVEHADSDGGGDPGAVTEAPTDTDGATKEPGNSTAVVTDAYAAMATELRASGVTVDWAPVADVTVPGQDVTIGSRAAGSDPAVVTRAVTAALEGFLEGGVLPAVKHFPGHGSLTADSHAALPVLGATDAELRTQDLPPFEAAVAAGVPMVMVGHIDVTAWDPGVPASVSPVAYQVLREELGFSGVTVTDSLGMGALNAVGGPGEVAVAALAAGADLLLNPADNYAAHAAVVAALEDGTLDRDKVDAAAGRVIAMMRHQAELAERAGPVGPDDVGSAAEAAAALSAAGQS